MSYRVDNLPWYLVVPVYIYAYILAAFMYLASWLVHVSSTITFKGAEYIADKKQNFIFCHWHEALPIYFATFLKQDRYHAWMNHPIWFMKPIHVYSSFVGINKLVLGSSGHDGKKALAELKNEIINGASTYVFPDGPAGPPKVLKPGIIELAYETKVPIIPIELSVSNYFQLNTWDKKKIPLPFSRIVVKYKAPIYVNSQNKEEAKKLLEDALGFNKTHSTKQPSIKQISNN